MAETRSFASLSSGLLARKGAAKPAMRPQGFGSFGGSLEDLGWNDMGHAPAPHHEPSSVEALTPPPPVRAVEAEAPPVPAPEPAVREQQKSLKASFAPAPSDPAPAGVEPERATLPRPRPVPAKGKAAFTLRLDPERHLKLRLACALTRRSAQQLVTEALDDFLAALPDVEALATQVPAKAGKR
jgi:predicted HicB family RNase H-like nuclease